MKYARIHSKTSKAWRKWAMTCNRSIVKQWSEEKLLERLLTPENYKVWERIQKVKHPSKECCICNTTKSVKYFLDDNPTCNRCYLIWK